MTAYYGLIPGDTINFNGLANGATITLQHSLGDIAFNKSLTIDGGTKNITINANDPTGGFHNNGDGNRIFNITDPTSGTLSATGDDFGS